MTDSIQKKTNNEYQFSIQNFIERKSQKVFHRKSKRDGLLSIKPTSPSLKKQSIYSSINREPRDQSEAKDSVQDHSQRSSLNKLQRYKKYSIHLLTNKDNKKTNTLAFSFLHHCKSLIKEVNSWTTHYESVDLDFSIKDISPFLLKTSKFPFVLSSFLEEDFQRLFQTVFLLQQYSAIVLLYLKLKQMDLKEDPLKSVFESIYQTFVFFLYMICLTLQNTVKGKIKRDFFNFVENEINPKNEDFFNFQLSPEEIKVYLNQIQKLTLTFLQEVTSFEQITFTQKMKINQFAEQHETLLLDRHQVMIKQLYQNLFDIEHDFLPALSPCFKYTLILDGTKILLNRTRSPWTNQSQAKRPYFFELLKELSPYFEIVILYQKNDKDNLVFTLEEETLIDYKVDLSDTHEKSMNFLKRNPFTSVLLATSSSQIHQPRENVIVLNKWDGESDLELMEVTVVLRKIAIKESEDVRDLLEIYKDNFM